MTLALIVGSTEIDLLEGGDGYRLRLDGWVPQVAQDEGEGYANVVETITLKAVGTSVPNLASSIREDIEETIHFVNSRINDPVAPDLAFLRWSLPGQTIERQALIYKISYGLGHSPFFPPVSSSYIEPALVLTIERAPFWEETSQSSYYINGAASGGDNVSPTWFPTHLGSVPGRIEQLMASGTTLTEFWVGFRTNKYGSYTNFEPAWPFDTVSTYNDATESGGTVTWTSGDTDLMERMRISMSQVASIPSTQRTDQRGTFLVLLRARSTGTETFNVRLSDGFLPFTGTTGTWNTHSRVKISSSSAEWQFRPLGTITIPPAGLRTTSMARTVLGAYCLRIYAEVNTAGTGSLEMTRFVFIPQDEGFLHVNGINTSSLANTYINNEVDGQWSVFSHWPSVGLVTTPTEFDVVNFYNPKDHYGVIFAGHSTAGQNLTATVDLAVQYRRRWLSLGGT